jgi:hypothetical protein
MEDGNMQTLFQNRTINNLFKFAYFVFLIALCCLTTVSSGWSKDQNALSEKAIIKFLSWEKYWYGTFFGEDCYNKLLGKTVRIAIRQNLRQEVARTFRCGSRRDEIIMQKTFDGYISNTNFLIYGIWLGNKPVAEISMGSAPPGCNVDDLKPMVKDLFKDGKTSYIKVVLRRVKSHSLPSIEDNLKNLLVLDAVRRSMRSFIDYYYFQPALSGEPQRTFSSELLEKIKQTDEILLGRFNEDDPFLLVYYNGDNKVYILDFPIKDMLIDSSICVQVYSAQPYLGEASSTLKENVMKHLMDTLKNNSIHLNFGKKGN